MSCRACQSAGRECADPECPHFGLSAPVKHERPRPRFRMALSFIIEGSPVRTDHLPALSACVNLLEAGGLRVVSTDIGPAPLGNFPPEA